MKHRNKLNYWQLSEWGSSFGFSFSGHEVLGNKILGLDGTKRKLLIVEKLSGQNYSSIIGIEDIKEVSVKKIYKNIKAGELKRKTIEEFLEFIILQIELSDGTDAMNLVFYENGVNQINDLPALEKKARNWQAMLSKIAIPKKGILQSIPVSAPVSIHCNTGIIEL